MTTTATRLPAWLRRQLPQSAERTHEILAQYKLNTVCESALCPNRTECYARNTATFMILGDVCTRSCGFCAIAAGKPLKVEADEPQRVAEAAAALGLEYVVITSVARDEMEDEGAEHFAQTVLAVKARIPGVQVEVLTPDFHGRRELIAKVVSARPTVFNHNLETVERLQKSVRPQAAYDRSLNFLKTVKELDPEMTTKSGIMLGLGESREEIMRAAKDLQAAGCDILTLGQYLAPSSTHLKVQNYFSPEEFKNLADDIKPLGFREVFAGPYVRSSYHAGETFLNAVAK
jgi:lipoyl synthase